VTSPVSPALVGISGLLVASLAGCLQTQFSSGTSAISSTGAGPTSSAAASSTGSSTGQPPGTSTGTAVASSAGASSAGSSTGSSTGTSSGTTGGSTTGLSFTATTYPVNGSPHWITTYQNDGGVVNLATADYNDGTIFTLPGNGNGTFQNPNPVFVASNASFQSICSGDFNGDGLADLAFSTWGSFDHGYGVLTGQSDGGFSVTLPNASFVSSLQILCAKLGGDALLDLLAPVGDALYILPGEVEAQFGQDEPLTSLGDYRAVAVGNFGANAMPQIAVAENGASMAAVLEREGDGGYALFDSWSTGQGPVGVTVADFNGDGCEDLATADNGGDSTTVVLSGCGNLGSSSSTYQCPGCGRPQWLVAADFDGNGSPDIAMAFYDPLPTGETVAIYLNLGDGTFAAPLFFNGGVGPSCIATGDFNGDGRPDLAISDIGGQSVTVLLHQ